MGIAGEGVAEQDRGNIAEVALHFGSEQYLLGDVSRLLIRQLADFAEADGDIPPADVPDGLLLGDANGQANGADVPPFQDRSTERFVPTCVLRAADDTVGETKGLALVFCGGCHGQNLVQQSYNDS
ncbi:mono/diheme cytochrome c family protein [Bradyrhizobium sp. GM5.1]